MSEYVTNAELRKLVDEVSNQLCVTVDDRFDFTVRASGNDETIEKLCMLVNFTLDAARRGLRQSEEKSEQLARSNRDLEQFAFAASHDLQAPLRGIVMFSELLKRNNLGRLSGDTEEYIEHIARAAREMTQLIQDLLEYAKLDYADQAREMVDCAQLVAQAIQNLAPTIKEADAFVTYGELPEVPGARTALLSVFQNLIGNAVKFHDGKPPHVHVAAYLRDEKWVFSVRDNGIGILPEDIGKLFTLFKRLHGNSEYPGTGVGLAICKKIILQHHGEIWVESRPGEGSIFYFTLPA